MFVCYLKWLHMPCPDEIPKHATKGILIVMFGHRDGFDHDTRDLSTMDHGDVLILPTWWWLRNYATCLVIWIDLEDWVFGYDVEKIYFIFGVYQEKLLRTGYGCAKCKYLDTTCYHIILHFLSTHHTFVWMSCIVDVMIYVSMLLHLWWSYKHCPRIVVAKRNKIDTRDLK